MNRSHVHVVVMRQHTSQPVNSVRSKCKPLGRIAKEHSRRIRELENHACGSCRKWLRACSTMEPLEAHRLSQSLIRRVKPWRLTRWQWAGCSSGHLKCFIFVTLYLQEARNAHTMIPFGNQCMEEGPTTSMKLVVRECGNSYTGPSKLCRKGEQTSRIM